MDFCDFLHDWLRRLMCICYSTDSPSFKCVNWLGIFMYYNVMKRTMVFFMQIGLCCLWGAIVFICIFDRSVTSLPSITDHHHWSASLTLSLWYRGGQKFDLDCYFCLKGWSHLLWFSIQYTYLVAEQLAYCIWGKLYISL